MAPALRRVRRQVRLVRAVAATLEQESGACSVRHKRFAALRKEFAGRDDPFSRHCARLMESFAEGLFAGGNDLELPIDNLDLERWFRSPKGHERRIHGHAHVGVRVVVEGPTLAPTLDAYSARGGPFDTADLLPYRQARVPACQEEATHRRRIMRRARSKKLRPALLRELERRYLESS